MNFQLFSAFLVITTVLILTPGPIVTLVISTGATQGVRAALDRRALSHLPRPQGLARGGERG